MKALVKAVKDVVIPCLIAGLAIGMIFLVALPLIGNSSESYVREKDYSTFTDETIFSAELEKQAPKITYFNNKIWIKSEPFYFKDAFMITDYQGNSLLNENGVVRVLNITDSAGISYMEDYDAVTNSIVLDFAGVYYFEIEAIDSGNRMTKDVYPVVIDN